MEKNQVRQNKATKQWVIYAPGRGKRPRDFRKKKNEQQNLPGIDADCPFCPGNEHMLPAIIDRFTNKQTQRWQSTIVPNKYPALVPEGTRTRKNKGIYITMNGIGRHEVIIEHPKHDQTIATMTEDEVDTVIETYHRRYVELMREHENMLTIIFRNHGAQAGTSLMHPHSQLIVTGFVPQHIRHREEEAQRFYDEWGHCVFCDILAFEIEAQTRIIAENNEIVAFVPFHAEVPFETWIMPKRHQADFGDINDSEKAALSETLRTILSKLYHKLNNPDYNYIINTSARYKSDEPQLHWYLQIRPRLTTQAGFEIGSGISINPSIPEEDADFLRV